MNTLRLGRYVAALILFAGLMEPALAQDRGTAAEAKAMVERGIQTFEKLGAKEAIKQFHAKKGPFKDRDLYLFVVGPDGKVAAQAFDPKRVGLDVKAIKDVTGAPYGQKLIEAANPGGAWVDYVRTDPITGKNLHKSSWVKKYKNHIFGVGIYKQEN